METLIVFGSFVTIVVAILRHRYRMKLLAAATARPDWMHLASFPEPPRAVRSGANANDAQVRVEALEERLEWLERLVRESGEAKALAGGAPVASLPSGSGHGSGPGPAANILAAVTASLERARSL